MLQHTVHLSGFKASCRFMSGIIQHDSSCTGSIKLLSVSIREWRSSLCPAYLVSYSPHHVSSSSSLNPYWLLWLMTTNTKPIWVPELVKQKLDGWAKCFLKASQKLDLNIIYFKFRTHYCLQELKLAMQKKKERAHWILNYLIFWPTSSFPFCIIKWLSHSLLASDVLILSF